MTKNSKPANNDAGQGPIDPNDPVHVVAAEEQRRALAEAEAAPSRGITTAEAPGKIAFGIVKECGNCDGFHRAPHPNQERGLCQRHPPMPLITGMENSPVGPRPVISSFFPVIGEHSRCSDWIEKDEAAQIDFATLGVKQ